MCKRCLLVILALLLTLIGAETFASSKTISIIGKWSDKILRSSINTQPIVSIDGTTLEIYFPAALNDVSVCLYDEYGAAVLEQYISVEAMEIFLINLTEKGQYYIAISQIDKGYINGDFEIVE